MNEEKSLRHVKESSITLMNSTKNFKHDNEEDEYGNESITDVYISDTEEIDENIRDYEWRVTGDDEKTQKR